MNCDEAFDALTDPDAQENSALKWHLEFCPRCREMQEVLAPALAMLTVEASDAFSEEETSPNRLPELFSDALGETSAAGSAHRRRPEPFLTPEAVHIAEQTARTLHPPRRWWASAWFRGIAVSALCLVISLGVFFDSASPEPATPAHSDPVILADECLWTERDTDTDTKPVEDPSARWVVLSCVSCHLEQSLE